LDSWLYPNTHSFYLTHSVHPLHAGIVFDYRCKSLTSSQGTTRAISYASNAHEEFLSAYLVLVCSNSQLCWHCCSCSRQLQSFHFCY